MKTIKLEIPKESEFISCARMSCASLAHTYGFDVDKIEDIKVMISEACIYFLNNIKKNSKPIVIECNFLDDIFEIVIFDSNISINNNISININDEDIENTKLKNTKFENIKNKDDSENLKNIDNPSMSDFTNDIFTLIMDSLADSYEVDLNNGKIVFCLNRK